MATVTFQPQAWVNNYAVDVDPEGPTTFVVPNADARGVADDTHESDHLQRHPNAPAWIRDWSGPFYITIDPSDDEAPPALDRNEDTIAHHPDTTHDAHNGHRRTVDDELERWTVHEPGTWENDSGPEGWYAVSNDDGILAYFGDERDAFRFRLSEINRTLNG